MDQVPASVVWKFPDLRRWSLFVWRLVALSVEVGLSLCGGWLLLVWRLVSLRVEVGCS